MRLLINHRQPKSISFEQFRYRSSQGIAVISLHCLLFSASKNKELKRISKKATNVVLALQFLNLTALRSTVMITMCYILLGL